MKAESLLIRNINLLEDHLIDCFKRGLNARTCTLWFTSTFVILPPPKYSPHNNLPITQCLLQRSELTNENLAPPLKPQNLWTLVQRFLSLKSFFFDFEWAFRRFLKRNGVFQSLQVLHAFIDNNSNAKAKLSIQANLFCNPATDTTTAKHQRNGRVSNDQQYAVMKDTEDDIPGNFLEDLMRKLRVDIIVLNNEVLPVITNLSIDYFWSTYQTSQMLQQLAGHRIWSYWSRCFNC